MSITLTTPIAVGDLDAADYSKAKITSFFIDLNNHHLNAKLEFGNEVEGVWVRGAHSVDKIISLDGEGFDSYFANNPTVYSAVRGALYQLAIDQGLVVGTID